MNRLQRSAFDREIAAAKSRIAAGDLSVAFTHLERAHVLGQSFVIPHVTSHWLMLQVELRRRQPMAVFGQFLRILLGALGSALGKVPIGNTGGTDISMFKTLPIEPELQGLIDGRTTEANRK